jgi:site-specific recombinase XerD
MPQLRRDQLIRLVPRSELAHEIAAFVIDCQARGLSPRTAELYADELCCLRTLLEAQRVNLVEHITPTLLRSYLLHLGTSRNAGGLHAAYSACRAFLRWYEREYEMEDWTNPIAQVQVLRVRKKPLDPMPLSDLKAMLATRERRTFTGDRDRAILLALLDNGCRASEIVALELDDVSLQSGAFVIHRRKGQVLHSFSRSKDAARGGALPETSGEWRTLVAYDARHSAYVFGSAPDCKTASRKGRRVSPIAAQS